MTLELEILVNYEPEAMEVTETIILFIFSFKFKTQLLLGLKIKLPAINISKSNKYNLAYKSIKYVLNCTILIIKYFYIFFKIDTFSENKWTKRRHSNASVVTMLSSLKIQTDHCIIKLRKWK